MSWGLCWGGAWGLSWGGESEQVAGGGAGGVGDAIRSPSARKAAVRIAKRADRDEQQRLIEAAQRQVEAAEQAQQSEAVQAQLATQAAIARALSTARQAVQPIQKQPLAQAAGREDQATAIDQARLDNRKRAAMLAALLLLS